MWKRSALAALLAALLLAPPALSRERGEDELRRDMEFARQQVYPALVNISVVVKMHSGGRSLRTAAAGSGVIVSPAGHVVTNFHVAGDTTRIVCRLPSKEAIEAEVITHDPLTDLSILRLKLETRKDRNKPIPFAKIGDSDELEVGDYVLAMGNPMALASSMTLGIVANPRRVMTSFTGSEMEEMEISEGQLTGLFTRWIQHDALILGGNSGGPLVNLSGEVIGINELGGGGMGFAIPSSLVSHVLNQALAHGEVIRGWLGVSLYPVEKAGGDRGVLVASVQPGGPADRAGLRPGDVIVALDGESADAVYFEEIPLLYKRIADYAPGTRVKVTCLRDGEEATSELVVEKMERYLADAEEVVSLGLTVRDITGPMALMRRYPDANGVLVTGVRPGFAADSAKPKLLSGDVLVDLDGKPVRDYAAMREIVAGIGKRDDVLVRVRRRDEDVVTVLDTTAKPKPFAGGELPKAWIGMKTQVLTPDVAKALSLGKTRGFRITQVFPGTEAEKAGLRVGDVVTALNGETLRAFRTQDSEMLERRVETLSVGESATVTVLRAGGEKRIELVLEETPRTAAEVKTAEDELLEYKVREVTFKDRIDRRWPMDRAGVLVTQVTAGGWASLAGLRTGDLVQKIGDRAIAGVSEFKEAVESVEKERPARVGIFVVRGYRTAFVFVEPVYAGGR